MRLIDADALINDIEELITEHEEMMRDSEEHPENYPEDYETRVLNLIAGLIAAKVEVDCAPTIDAEPVKHGEWIPCSERLPNEDGQYLVFYEGTIIGSRIEIMWYSEPSMPNVDVSGKHFYRSDSEWGDIIYDEVIAWMPLPKPYRKGDK